MTGHTGNIPPETIETLLEMAEIMEVKAGKDPALASAAVALASLACESAKKRCEHTGDIDFYYYATPIYAQSLALLASCHNIAGNRKEAEAALEQARNADKTNPHVLIASAKLHISQSRYREAREDLETVFAHEHCPENAYDVLVSAICATRILGSDKPHLIRLLDRDPGYPLGQRLCETGKTEKALAFFRQAVRQHPFSRGIVTSLVFCLHETGDTDKALSAANGYARRLAGRIKETKEFLERLEKDRAFVQDLKNPDTHATCLKADPNKTEGSQEEIAYIETRLGLSLLDANRPGKALVHIKSAWETAIHIGNEALEETNEASYGYCLDALEKAQRHREPVPSL